MDKAYWRLKKREQRLKAKGEVVTVTPLPLDKKLMVTMEYNAERFPDRKAFEVAVARVARAQRYALKFPHLIRGDDVKYQDVRWQYEHEGLAAVRKPATHSVQ